MALFEATPGKPPSASSEWIVAETADRAAVIGFVQPIAPAPCGRGATTMQIDSHSDHAKREMKARSKARRLGLGLMKSRVRNPQSPSFSGYMIVDPDQNAIVRGAHPFVFSMDLEQVEDFLAEAENN